MRTYVRMTHPPDRIATALELRNRGFTATQASRRLNIPRATVRDWFAGHLPEVATRTGGSCARCGGAAHPLDRVDRQYAYLLGLYLGDGCVSAHHRGVFKLRVFLDVRYPGIIAECRTAMRAVLPPGRATGVVSKRGCVEVYSFWKGWPCLLPQHGEGMKHTRPIVLAEWQQTVADRHPDALLRGLIHSDGCRFISTGTNWRSPRYSFSNRSDDIRRIFCEACARLGLRWTTAPRTVYVSRRADVAVLDTFIGPKV
jgi:hypothetical protein